MNDLTDLDYKDLFRDAVNMMAHIARAAGFDPADPTVEPPAIVARVENLRAEVERLTAERAALLAPVGEVDLEDVLRLDREATQEPWRSYNAAPFKESIPLLTTDEIGRPMVRYEADEPLIVCYRSAAPALAREVIQLRAAVRFADEQGAEAIERVSSEVVAEKWNSTAQLQEEVKRLTANLTTARRLLPPRYVAADGSILDPERCTPHAPDCAECGRGRAHDEGCLALQATPAEEAVGLRAEVERLSAELEGARLTLAAEQGRPEGAPSAGWRAISLTGWELFVDGGRSAAVWRFVDGKGWGWWTERGRAGEAPTARAAMIAADASTPAPTPE